MAELAVTQPDLAYEENLYLLELLERTLIEDCRKRGMLGICAVNVNAVTQVRQIYARRHRLHGIHFLQN
jgi:hypothetical protein